MWWTDQGLLAFICAFLRSTLEILIFIFNLVSMFWDQVTPNFSISSVKKKYLRSEYWIQNLDSFNFSRLHFIDRWLFLNLGKKEMPDGESKKQHSDWNHYDNRERKNSHSDIFWIICFIYFKFFRVNILL